MPHAFATLAFVVIVGPGKNVIPAVGPEPRADSVTTMTGMGAVTGLVQMGNCVPMGLGVWPNFFSVKDTVPIKPLRKSGS
jgi:hypothetical protein